MAPALSSGPWLAAALAEALDGRLVGPDPGPLTGLCALAEAGPQQLSFLANPRYRRQLEGSAAGLVLVRPGTPRSGGATLEVADPYAAFARALALFHPPAPVQPGLDPRAFIGAGAQVVGCRVDAFAWIGPEAVLGPGCWVEAGAVVGAGARLGAACRLMANSVVAEGCVLGDRVWLNPGAVIGSEGFGFAPTALGHLKIPQTGIVVIEDDVEVGANACVDRPAMGQTRVGRGSKLDNLVQVGHAAEIGPDSLLVAFSGVAGSSRLGRGVVLAARAAVLGHVRLGDGVQVGVGSAVAADQPAGARVTGVPAIDHDRWLRATAALSRLPETQAELRALRRQVAALEARVAALLPAAPEIDPPPEPAPRSPDEP